MPEPTHGSSLMRRANPLHQQAGRMDRQLHREFQVARERCIGRVRLASRATGTTTDPGDLWQAEGPAHQQRRCRLLMRFKQFWHVIQSHDHVASAEQFPSRNPLSTSAQEQNSVPRSALPPRRESRLPRDSDRSTREVIGGRRPLTSGSLSRGGGEPASVASPRER